MACTSKRNVVAHMLAHVVSVIENRPPGKTPVLNVGRLSASNNGVGPCSNEGERMYGRLLILAA
jgi:hypothetical protein